MCKKNVINVEEISRTEIINILAKRIQMGKISVEEQATVGQYYSLQAPRKIYRYRPGNSKDMEALMRNEIWFSSISCLNDPFEFNIKVDPERFVASDKDMKNKMNTMPPLQQQAIYKKMREAVDYEVYYRDVLPNYTIACFSERNDSLLMWGHYSDGHKGICLEYDTLNSDYLNKRVVIPVNYTDEPPALTGKDQTTFYRLLLEMMSTKSRDWEYEREWRCIQDKGACGDKWTSKGAQLDFSVPTAIYVGCKAENTLVKSLIYTCKEVLGIPLYKMVKSNIKYKLLPEQII